MTLVVNNTAEQPHMLWLLRTAEQALQHRRSHFISTTMADLPKFIPSFSSASASLELHGFHDRADSSRKEFHKAIYIIAFHLKRFIFALSHKTVKIYPWHNDTGILINKKAVCCHKRKVSNVTSSLFCIYWHYFYDNYSFSLENSKEKNLQLVLVDQEEVVFDGISNT